MKNANDLVSVVQVNKVIRESLEAGKTYNKSITAKTTQVRLLINGDPAILVFSRRKLTV